MSAGFPLRGDGAAWPHDAASAMKHSPTYVRVDSPRELERLTRLANDTVATESRRHYLAATRRCRQMWLAVAAVAALGLSVHYVENSALRRHLCGRTLSCELVVCSCNESIAWVPRIAANCAAPPASNTSRSAARGTRSAARRPRRRPHPPARAVERVTIYTKCGTAPNFGLGVASPAGTRVVPLPNIGNNDFAFLVHILETWEELKPEVVFSEAEVCDDHRRLHRRLHRPNPTAAFLRARNAHPAPPLWPSTRRSIGSGRGSGSRPGRSTR